MPVATIVLPYPISANRYWRTVVNGHRAMMVPTAEAKAFRTEVGYLARAAGLRTPSTGWIVLDLTLHPPEPKDVADWPTWRVEAGWLGVDQMPAACLRPITDTDIDTADQVDCMDMNLLAVLSFTREAV